MTGTGRDAVMMRAFWMGSDSVEMIASLKTVGLFVLTAAAEIFGCYTVYACLKTNCRHGGLPPARWAWRCLPGS
jgi:hypothetical protein